MRAELAKIIGPEAIGGLGPALTLNYRVRTSPLSGDWGPGRRPAISIT